MCDHLDKIPTYNSPPVKYPKVKVHRRTKYLLLNFGSTLIPVQSRFARILRLFCYVIMILAPQLSLRYQGDYGLLHFKTVPINYVKKTTSSEPLWSKSGDFSVPLATILRPHLWCEGGLQIPSRVGKVHQLLLSDGRLMTIYWGELRAVWGFGVASSSSLHSTGLFSVSGGCDCARTRAAWFPQFTFNWNRVLPSLFFNGFNGKRWKQSPNIEKSGNLQITFPTSRS